MMDRISRAAAAQTLFVSGAFWEDEETVILLSPEGADFWRHLKASAEFGDGAPDPVDRWSVRVVGALAAELGARPVLPSGPERGPFVTWALKSGRTWQSPVSLLVHDRAGLMISWRGALVFPGRLDLPAPPPRSPCDSCVERPCLGACPAAALTARGYDLAACHAFLDTRPGADCMNAGCAVRRACPLSQSHGRLDEQSAHHMRYFHRSE